MTTAPQEPLRQRYLTIDSCHDCSNQMEMVCLYKPLGMIPMPNGKEAFDYRNRYVCTEKDDREIDNDLPDWCPLPTHPTAPVPNKLPKHGDCPDCPILTGEDAKRFNDYLENPPKETPESRAMIKRAWELSKTISLDPEHDAATAKAERERFADMMFRTVRVLVLTEGFVPTAIRCEVMQIREEIANSLRQPEEP